MYIRPPYKTNQLAKNLAHVLTKVVRADWPRRWPDLFEQLLAKLQLDDEAAASSEVCGDGVCLRG